MNLAQSVSVKLKQIYLFISRIQAATAQTAK